MSYYNIVRTLYLCNSCFALMSGFWIRPEQLIVRPWQNSVCSFHPDMIDDLLDSMEDNAPNQIPLVADISQPLSSAGLPLKSESKTVIDENAIRSSPFGKVAFGVLDNLFPVLKEANWYDAYDPPLPAEQNMQLPFFDGYDFANSSWTIYVRHRLGAWNWLDRLGLVPQATQRVFLREDGKTMWSDGFYGDWYINPAINFFQMEKHYGRGYGYSQYHRGIRVYQIQSWNFEPSIGRYWQRGLRSYLRNESDYFAFEGRIWGMGAKWRPAPRDQGKFIAIRDGTNLTAVFGSARNTPWEARFRHAMSLPFYQAHPDQLERVEDNFDMYYRNLLGPSVR